MQGGGQQGGPVGGGVEGAVDDQRRGLLTAVGIEFVRPGHAQLTDRIGIDLGQWAIALL